MRKILTITILSLIFNHNCFAQQISTDSLQRSSFNIFSPEVISVAAVSGFYAGTLVDSYITWWKDDKRPFTFLNDPWFDNSSDYGMDKLGHFYTSYFFYKVQKDILLWGGYSNSTAKWVSGSLTTMMALLIEIGDGFSRYGFDVKDLISNSAGLAYAILQDEVPFLQNFNVKWSYFPSNGFSFPPRFSNHYEGHIYWLTFNLHNIWNQFGENPWPEFLQPAIGYSIGKNSVREYVFGLDINLLPLFQSEKPVVTYLGNLINLFHLPSPGIKYINGKKPDYKLLLLN